MNNSQLYFIALILPLELEKEVAELKMHMFTHYDSKAALRSPPHITLYMPFKYNEGKEDHIINSLQKFCENIQCFEVKIENFGAFVPRVIYLNVLNSVDINHLHTNLEQWMKQKLKVFTRPNPVRAFHPHITVAFRDLKKSKFYKAWEEFEDIKKQEDFIADGLQLLKHDGKQWQKFKFFSFKN